MGDPMTTRHPTGDVMTYSHTINVIGVCHSVADVMINSIVYTMA